MEEKNYTRSKDLTRQRLLDAVGEIVESEGFEKLGVNSVAAKAGVSKILIYKYFESFEGLIAAFIESHDLLASGDVDTDSIADTADFVKKFYENHINRIRNSYAYRRLMQWELTDDNRFAQELRAKREEAGLKLTEAVSSSFGTPEHLNAVATIVSAGLTYLGILSDHCDYYNGINLNSEEGWKEIKAGTDVLIDEYFNKK